MIAYGLELDLERSFELSLFEGDRFVGWWIGAIAFGLELDLERSPELSLFEGDRFCGGVV